MRAILLATVLFLLTGSGFAAPTTGRLAGLDIRVEEGGWGGMPAASIEKILYAVADVLLPRLPRKLAAPIIVTHTHRNPITLYERGPRGEYLVRLHASGARTHLYVYEFAHELAHIVSNYEHNVGGNSSRPNQWVEESLCEAASLFVLGRLAAVWSELPPGDELAAAAPELRTFYERLVAEEHRHLPADHGFGTWLAANEGRLRADPYQRKKDDLVARLLLPLFERSPDSWDALCYLNLDIADNDASLAQYLAHWHRNAPAEHRPFIGSVFETLAAGPAGELDAVANATPPPEPVATLPAMPDLLLSSNL